MANRGDATRSVGCGHAAPHGILMRSTTDGNGTQRAYRLLVPTDYQPSRPYPLVFVFHGAGGTEADAFGWGLQNAPGAAGGAIFVFPRGIDFNHEGAGWDDRSQSYDLAFFDHMREQISDGYCTNPGQLFVAGFSWGGDFSIVLACNRGEAIRAIAANSTTDEFNDPKDFMSYQDLPCRSHRHPAVRYVHADGGDAKYPPPDFESTSKLLRYLNTCSAASTPLETSPMSCVSYRGCAAETVECAFDPAIGHTLPPHWAEDTWAFFSAHSLKNSRRTAQP